MNILDFYEAVPLDKPLPRITSSRQQTIWTDGGSMKAIVSALKFQSQTVEEFQSVPMIDLDVCGRSMSEMVGRTLDASFLVWLDLDPQVEYECSPLELRLARHPRVEMNLTGRELAILGMVAAELDVPVTAGLRRAMSFTDETAIVMDNFEILDLRRLLNALRSAYHRRGRTRDIVEFFDNLRSPLNAPWFLKGSQPPEVGEPKYIHLPTYLSPGLCKRIYRMLPSPGMPLPSDLVSEIESKTAAWLNPGGVLRKVLVDA